GARQAPAREPPARRAPADLQLDRGRVERRPMIPATVVICTHERAAILGRAVGRAVDEARAGEAEVLVVDNASTDGTPALLARLEEQHGPILRSVREPELGLSAARNRGLAEPRTEVVAFLDDDAV